MTAEHSPGLARKSTALSRPDDLYWLHYRTLEPFIIAELSQSAAPLLDLGCGNKLYRSHYPAGESIGVDVQQSSENCVDVVIDDAAALPFVDNHFASILCTQVLEHVPDAVGLLKECCRVPRAGGRLILTCPFVWELHEEPHDLRFTRYWLERNLKAVGFSEVVISPQGGDVAMIGQAILLVMARRQRFFPRWLLKRFNCFIDAWDRSSPSNHMTLNYGIVATR